MAKQRGKEKETEASATVEVEPEESAPSDEAGANNQHTPLSDQIDKLGSFILGLDCGYPRATETYPAGMSATEAAEEYIKELRAYVARLKEDHVGVCALLARIHAFAVGEVTGPNRGVVEDVEDVISGLRARVAELEGNAAVETRDVGATSSSDVGRAAEAYALFCQGRAEGDFPAWAELPEQTQKLWRDGYQHVAAGGEPRTDYEEVVKYLIASAQ
jgi:hypothetical protein